MPPKTALQTTRLGAIFTGTQILVAIDSEAVIQVSNTINLSYICLGLAAICNHLELKVKGGRTA